MVDGHQIAIDDKIDPELTRQVMEISVEESADGPRTFRVKFAVDICKKEHTLLEDPRFLPSARDRLLSVYATSKAGRVCLVRGVLTKRKVGLVQGGPGSSLELHGQDRLTLLSRKVVPATYTGTAGSIARAVLASHGYRLPEQSVEASGRDYRQLNQTKNALEFLTVLAGHNGAHLWVSYAMDNQGRVTETVNFRRSPEQPASDGKPTRLAKTTEIVLALNAANPCVNNLTAFEVEVNHDVPTSSGQISAVDDQLVDLQRAEVTPNVPYLAKAKPRAGVQNRVSGPPGDLAAAHATNESALNDASWAIKAKAETTAYALKDIVRPHMVVTVQGTGKLDDGTYFVNAVSHTLDASSHKMSIELVRNAQGESR